MSAHVHRAQPEPDEAHPFRLRRIDLENFKSVESASVDLGPLSVLVGVNSSGKSTFLQVALAACQAIKEGTSTTEFLLNGDLQRLGTYEDVHNFRSRHGPIRIGFQIVEPSSESKDGHKTTQPDNTSLYSPNTGPYTFEWSMKLAKGTDLPTGTCEVAHSLAISSFAGSESVVNQMMAQERSIDGVTPLFSSLVRARSRAEQFAISWWDTLEEYLSVDESRETLNQGRFSKRDYQEIAFNLGIDNTVDVLARVATSDLRNAKALFEDPFQLFDDQSKSHDDSAIVPWGVRVWLLDHFDRPVNKWDEALITNVELLSTKTVGDPEKDKKILHTVLTFLLLSSNKREFQRHVGSDLGYDRWWAEGALPEVPGLGTYRWRDEDDWTAIGIVDEILANWFRSKLSYLGPLRKSPEDPTTSGQRPLKDLGTRGEYAEAVLNLQADRPVRIPLPNGYERELPLGQALNSWLEWFDLADDAQALDRGRDGFEFNVRPRGASRSVHLSSVGVGVSQVLPVILLCLLSEAADLLILEQPELHLHPALQKRLADFLLVFVGAGRQILVETHSDHLVNRLRYQVASDDTDEIRDLVKLIFAEQKDGITTYRESDINEYGGLSEDWPDGFLDISARSAQDLVRQSLRKMKARGGRADPGSCRL